MNKEIINTEEKSCEVYKKCSGCQLRNMSYEETLKFKQIRVDRLMGRLCHADRIIGMENPHGYRHKVQAAYDFRSGKALCGVYQSATGGICAVKNCDSNHPKANEIAEAVRKTALKLKLSFWCSYNRTGFLRSVMIRIAGGTGEIMCVVTGTDKNFPSKSYFAKEIAKLCPDITTLVFSVNNSDKLTTGKYPEVLFGKGFINEVICGKKFIISPESFAQINYTQTEKLYNLAMKYADVKQNETIIDAYCGIGTLSLMAAEKSKMVYGCEISRSAINDAVKNAKLNKADNVKFICSDTGKFLEEFAEEKLHADTVILDPARAGCDRRALNSLVKIAPKKIVYVSCNPETQAENLFFLLKNGYKIKKLTPVDMFPFTNHVETVALLSKLNIDNHIDVKQKNK